MPLHMVTRGAKSGTCNICGVDGPLTEDHTPPKGCVRPTAMELQHVTHRIDAGKAIKTKAQDGVKYRTLCARCNNTLLGGRYDPVLIDCSAVTRMDFLSAGALLNLLTTVKRQGRQVIFRHPNYLLAELFRVVGLKAVADVVLARR